MRITKLGTDYIILDERTYLSERLRSIPRVHLIKLEFSDPSLVRQVFNIYPRTNRFVIEDKIKEYNSILRRTTKKYYVMNRDNTDIISFFRKNNKVLLNFLNLSKEERDFFLMDGVFEDVLKNTEVIAMTKKMHDEKIEVLDKWRGNVIIARHSYDL